MSKSRKKVNKGKKRKKTKQPPITSTSKTKEMKELLKMALLVVGVILAMVVITEVVLFRPDSTTACVAILEKLLPIAIACMTNQLDT